MTTITPEITQAIAEFNEYAERFEWIRYPHLNATLEIGEIDGRGIVSYVLRKFTSEEDRITILGITPRNIALLQAQMRNAFEGYKEEVLHLTSSRYIAAFGKATFEEMRNNGFLTESPFIVSFPDGVYSRLYTCRKKRHSSSTYEGLFENYLRFCLDNPNIAYKEDAYEHYESYKNS